MASFWYGCICGGCVMRFQGAQYKVSIRGKVIFAVLLGVFTLATSFFVFENKDAQAQDVIERLHIFPGEITSTDWVNVQALYVQDIFEDATFGEFSPSNSAFISLDGEEEVVATDTSTSSVQATSTGEIATTTPEVLEEEIATTTSTSSTSSEQEASVQATSTDSEQATSTEEDSVETEEKGFIESVIDFFTGGDQASTTQDENQSASVIESVNQSVQDEALASSTEPVFEAIPESVIEENPSTSSVQVSSTEPVIEEEQASSTISAVWQVIKGLFTNPAFATSTPEVEEDAVPDEPEIVEDETDTSTSSTSSEQEASVQATSTPEVVEEEIATSTDSVQATTTEEVATTTPEASEDEVAADTSTSSVQATSTEEEVVIEEEVDPNADTEAPVIVINGNNPAYIPVGSSYNDLGALIPAIEDQFLGIVTFVNGVEVDSITLDTSTSTVYEIEYRASDAAGNVGSETRIVYVGDAEEIVIDPEDELLLTNVFGDTEFCSEETENCIRKEVTFSDFSVAEFFAEQDLQNAQLRFSFAGQPHPSSKEGEEGLVVEYFYADEWRESGRLAISEEVSNALNGGYFLYALPVFEGWGDFTDLQIRIRYESASGVIGTIYLESLWLEIDSGVEVPEAFDPEVEVYKRDLKKPLLNDLLTPVRDFKGGDTLEFRLKYNLQRNPVVRFLRSVFEGEQYVLQDTKLVHPLHGEIDANFTAEYGDDGEWSLRLSEIPQKMPPGKYTLRLTIAEGGESFVDEFDFYWGVLAINANKDIYATQEEASIHMGVVDDVGNTICDANLRLIVTDPFGSSVEVPVSQSGECHGNNVTDVPDYFAHYTTTELGDYTLALQHLNTLGEIIKETTSSFEVRALSQTPFILERIGPSRIYPPAEYKMKLRLTSRDEFNGFLVERLPKGFVLESTNGAGEGVFEDHKTLTWPVHFEAGETKEFSYVFDAPDISPFLYLLGPAEIGEYTENRTWQIASDAISNVAWLTGLDTTNATTSFNTSLGDIVWSTSSVDTVYFTHSTSSNADRLYVDQSGDYLVSATLPLARDDGVNNERARVELDIRVDGVKQNVGVGRSSYLRGTGGGNLHTESSSHINVLLEGLTAGQYIEIGTTGVADTTYPATTTGASLFVEYIGSGETIFTATSSQTEFTTDLNEPIASLVWYTSREDSGYTHTSSSTDIQLDAASNYLVFVNVPLTTTDQRQNVKGTLTLDGYTLPGTTFAQGYIRDSDGDTTSSIHYGGVITATTTNQILNVTVEEEANTGVTTMGSEMGTIYIQELPASDIFFARGSTTAGGGVDFNIASPLGIEWTTQDIIDGSVFTHSETVNPHQVTVDTAGNYYVVFNDSITSGSARLNTRVQITVNGSPIDGAETKSHYLRNANNHNESSGQLTYLLTDLNANDIIEITTMAESDTGGTGSPLDDATVLIWRKATFNEPPEAPSLHDIPFDNERLASSTPSFEFTGSDPDGVSDIRYQISWSTSTNFLASTTRTSGTDSGFANTVSQADTDPFNEGERIIFGIQSADALENGETYYWRVRAADISGSNGYGEWSTTRSFTVDLSLATSEWFQTEDGQFSSNTLTNTEVSGSDSVQLSTAANTQALLVYGESGVNTPRYRFWNGSSWDAPANALDVGAEVQFVSVAAAPTRDEYIAVTLDADEDVNAQVYTASTTSWGNLNEITTTAGSATTSAFEVAYENTSGDAIVVACNGTEALYKTWDGNSWSGSTAITLSITRDCEWIRLAEDPTSDEIVMVVGESGDNGEFEALVWDGSAWGNSLIFGDIIEFEMEGMDVEYEESGGQAVVVASAGGTDFVYNTWDGTDWAVTTTEVSPQNEIEYVSLARDVGSDRLALCYIDQSNDIGYLTWDGTQFTDFIELSITGESRFAQPVDCTFETISGRDGNVMVTYSNTTFSAYNTFDGSSWSATGTVATIEDSWLVRNTRTGDGVILTMYFDHPNDELYISSWNGTTWASETTISTSPPVTATPITEYAYIAAKRFSSGSGNVESTVIDHDYIPSQETWGDVSFSTTEPAGSDITLQLYYTNSATCDTIVPNGDLPGNAAGFDVSSSPIDISGLSTTTYNEICLRANLTQSGLSPTLDDWSVAWERQPVLTQNYYRWYDNVAGFTPTDVWPPGGTDLNENEALALTEPFDPNGIIRLRTSIEASSVALATTSRAFKLQFAEGLTCSASLDWIDLGDTASTTALFRGYDNSIVTSDWYGGSWTARKSITIPASQIDDDLADFPVVVDLADLGSDFFAEITSDGGDIRVTRSDGTTEVEREIVSASSTLETGELWFKANSLSSTTDNVFYIYYGNATATDYAASATYGAENVWTNGFTAVFHMEEDPGGSAPQMVDSTGNSHDATTDNMGSSNETSGKIGNGVDVNGTDESVIAPGFTSLGTANQAYSIGVWFNADTGETDGNLIGMSVNNPPGSWRLPPIALNAGSAQAISWTGSQSTALGTTTVGFEVWRQAYTTWDASNGLAIYLDGNEDNTNAQGTYSASGGSNFLHIAGDVAGGAGDEGHFDGQIDEIHVYDERKPSNWILTEYRNMATTTDFYTVSSQEQVSDNRELPSTLLSVSDKAQTYEQENNTASNPNAIESTEDGEWDFVIQNSAATAGTNYCFRMVTSEGTPLDGYNNYPQLITNSVPDAPTLTVLFDNEATSTPTPYFEFVAADDANDDLKYQIQVDNDNDFTSTVIDANSESDTTAFVNIITPSDKNPFTAGQTVRFTATTTLTNGVTYWWRVRAIDPNGSNEWGSWSGLRSFTINTSASVSTWFQTTDEQFDTDTLEQTETSGGSDQVQVTVPFTTATTTSTAIDFDDGTVGNSWGSFDFNDTEGAGDISYSLEFLDTSSDTWTVIPNSVLSGNEAGFDAGPVSLFALDTDIYNQIRIVGTFTGSAPTLQDWTIEWGQAVEKPTLNTLFDNEKTPTTTPAFTFFSTDPQSDDLQYEISISTTTDFTASTTRRSGDDTGFTNTVNGADTSPFNENETIEFQLQPADELASSTTYWWRVRARDPSGGNTWSIWSDLRSFTTDTSVTVSTWFQTTAAQFETDSLTNLQTLSTTSVQISTAIQEAMIVYGESTVQSPRYRLWNGSEWSEELSASGIGSSVGWVRVKGAPTRNEYALGIQGISANNITFQIYTGSTTSWGNLFEVNDGTVPNDDRRSFDIVYESQSGDALAVACDGVNDAVYTTWNGTSWSATTSLNLLNGSTCEWIQLSPSPTTDDIILVARDNGGAPEYEVAVWDGSSWGNQQLVTGSSHAENENEGIAIEWEESGDQAVVAVSNGGAQSFVTLNWDGIAWSGVTTITIGDDFEEGYMSRDVGTDNMVLCYIDQDNDLGIVRWNGSSWETFQEFEIFGNNSHDARPIGCEFETQGSRDGYIMIPHTNTNTGAYTQWNGTALSATSSIATTTDSMWVQSMRTGEGLIFAAFMDDINDDTYVSVWDGTEWSSQFVVETTNSDLGGQVTQTMMITPRVYPESTVGTIQSPNITFSDGTGPKWGDFQWNDVTPGMSDILYRVYYQTSTSSIALVPDTEIPDNSLGTSSSPIDLGDVDFTTYNILRVQGDFACDGGDCPELEDWTVTWSEGITVSGTANGYDQVATTTSGSVAIAVNGVLQSGKSGTIDANGDWSITNVTVFEDQPITVFINGAADANEAMAVTVYDGIGDVTGMKLFDRHITIGSDDVSTTTNTHLGHYDLSGSGDDDIFVELDAGDNITATSTGSGFDDVELYVLNNGAFRPSSTTNETVTLHDIEIDGNFFADGSTVNIVGSWDNNGIFDEGSSSFVFTATSTQEVIDSLGEVSSTTFNNVTFGQTSGSATWSPYSTLDVDGNLNIDYGTLKPTSTAITIAGNFTINTNGVFDKGTATTTFDGSGTSVWTDNGSPTSDMGSVVIDGSTKTVAFGSTVAATDIIIGANDQLDASGTNEDIIVYGSWTNNNVFVPRQGEVFFRASSTGIVIDDGSSGFYDLTFDGPDGGWSFFNPTLDVNNNFTVSTGTVTMTTATTTVGGSFDSSGGFFTHNNGVLDFDSSGAETITASGTNFFNGFNRLAFTGSGNWAFQDTHATASEDVLITGNGTVTFPEGTFAIAGSLSVTAGGFDANTGTVRFNAQTEQQIVRLNGSIFYDVEFADGSSGGGAAWYDTNWLSRIAVTVDSEYVLSDLTDFPIYVDLGDFGSTFFNSINADGGDIRVTASDGTTELSREVVSASTTTQTGELHFKAPTVTSASDSTFYIYFGNSAASDYAITDVYGAESVWTNDFDAVFHMEEDPGGSSPQMIDSTAQSHDAEAFFMDVSNQTTSGIINNAVIHNGSDEYTRSSGYSDLGTANSEYAISAWINADTGETDGNILHVSSGSTGGGWCLPMLALNGSAVQAISWAPGQSTALATTTITTGQWHHAYHTWSSSAGLTIYFDGFESDNTAQANFSASGGSNYVFTGFSPGSCGGDEGYFDGNIDEVRISTSTRSSAWVYAEYNNQTTNQNFYATSSAESFVNWTFTETNATSTHDFVIEAGTVIFPTDTMTVGGSFIVDPLGEFTNSTGTVRFTATSTGNVVDNGGNDFYDVFVDGTGNLSVIANATSSNNWSLYNMNNFEVLASTTIEVTGQFRNELTSASTTWSESVLYLNSFDQSYTINDKGVGDQYGTLQIGTSTDIRMWASEATSTVVIETGGSLYSQDHASTSGDLFVYGDYIRNSGTDYWSYATDFDGTDLSGGNERQVDVRFADLSTTTFNGATLQILGSTTATTTIDAQGANNFGVYLNGSTINAQYYSFDNLDGQGLVLTGSSTVTSLQDGSFTLDVSGGTTMTVGTETLDDNPALQIQRVNFATTSAITGFNVTATGTPVSYWWFRNHTGNLDGEDYDSDPGGTPGNVRWDDSNFSINVSGRVYADRGDTDLSSSATCDGVTNVVRVRVNGVGDHIAPCSGVDGTFTVSGVAFLGDPDLTIFLDNALGGERAVAVTRTPTGDITDLDLYVDHVIVRHESVDTMAISNLDAYDSGNDADVPFLATIGSPSSLVVEPNVGLYIWQEKTFAPDGNVTLESGGSGDIQDGSLYVDNLGTFEGSGSQAHSIGGSWVLDLFAEYISASTTVTFTATTTGKTIANATSTFDNLVFNGSGGNWAIGSSTTVYGDITMTLGTLSGTEDVTIHGGDLSGAGTVSMSDGNVTLIGDGNLGNSNNEWTFSSLTLGNGVELATTTKLGTGSITITGVFTIDTNHIFDASSSNLNIDGPGIPFVINGSYIPSNGLVSYRSAIPATITATDYARLTVSATSSNPTHSLAAGTFTVDEDFTVGDGVNQVTVNADTNDPTLTVNGTTTITTDGTFVGSSDNTMTVGASWLTFGTFSNGNGTVLFNATTTGHSIQASTSPFFNITLDSATGGWTITGDATSTNNFNLNNANDFTLASDVSLAVSGQFANGVGGNATTWTGSELYLDSGTSYSVNTKTAGADNYEALTVGPNTDIRTWNSVGTTTSVVDSGSLYSQDHDDQTGDLYIWGDYQISLATDYWSYATDFDGTDLTGGGERQVNVYLGDNSTTSVSGGRLNILGDPTATTTIQAQGSGTYAHEVTSGTTTMQYYRIRDINAPGLQFSGSPEVSELGNGDFLLEIDGGSMITVAGSVIDANSGQTYTSNSFATSSGVASGFNVTATGVSVGSWRFTSYQGNYGGEANDSDPGGDPGYIIWDDSDSQITVSGTVYADEGSTFIGNPPCDGTTQVVQLRVGGVGSFSASCNATTGNYSIPGIAFTPGDVITVYLTTNAASARAVAVTVDPLTNISNMDLYENRVIVRHEDSDAITIDDLAVFDSDNDANIPFDAESGSPDTLNIEAGTELYVWTAKSFTPGGNITLHGNASTEPDGGLHIADNAAFNATGTEVHNIAGSFDMKANASFDAGQSTINFTATTTGRIISATTSPFYDMNFTGSGGAWSFPPNTVSVDNDLTITAGTVTFGNGTSTVSGSFSNTGGSFAHNNGTLFLNATTTGQSIEAGGSSFGALTLDGLGGAWTFQDANATVTASFVQNNGSTTLPVDSFAVGGSFNVAGGSFVQDSGTLYMNSVGNEELQLNGSYFADLLMDGVGSTITIYDTTATSVGTITVVDGNLVLPNDTLAVANGFVVAGTFDNATGTVRLYGTTTGHVVFASSSPFYNLIFDGVTGGWALTSDATTTNNLSLINADSWSANGLVTVSGEFENLVGGASTTWTNSALHLYSGTNYSINTKLAGGDAYETLVIGESGTSTDIRMWNSTSTIYTVNGTSSIYSQDHNAVDGELYIFGQYERSSGADYWSYATDFDGTALGVGSRQVTVRHADLATSTFSGGTLNIIGDPTASTTITNQGSGNFGLTMTSGTFNADYFATRNLNGIGLYLDGSGITVTNMSSGDFELGVDGGTMATIGSSTIDANPTVTITNTRFATSTGIASGFNFTRSGTPTNAWDITGHYGNYDGEAFDSDGGDDCGSFKWDDSTCLETSQTHYRIRNDDGGEGELDASWGPGGSWLKRQRIHLNEQAGSTIANAAVEMIVPYDSDMQVDFDDLRFTDDGGTTTLDHYIEEVTASTNATVWVRIPSLTGSATTSIYMYYDNATATDASATTTFLFADNYEDNNISEYSGDTSQFDTLAAFNYEGSYGLGAAAGQESSQTTDGIYRTDISMSQGETIRFFQYVDMNTPPSGGADDEPCMLFGVQTPGSGNNNYAVCLDPLGTDQIVIAEDVSSNDGSGTALDTTNVTFTTGWYEVEIDWLTTDAINVNVYDDNGTFFASANATDTTYTTGGVGFSFWFQNGGWDFVNSRPYIADEPTVLFEGVEQEAGGATWKADEDTRYVGQHVLENVRVRFGIENSGANLTDQNFLLEAAPKTGFSQCESVPSASYVPVVTDGSCTSNHFACMATSSNFVNGASTTPLLTDPLSLGFTYGQIVEDPSNTTGNIDVAQGEYTEVEFNFQFTANATSSSYCLRTTDNGSAFDSYSRVADIEILQAPILTSFTLNSAQDIILTNPGGTTTIMATGTAIDLNGYTDLDYATATIYRSGVGNHCSLDENNCYPVASTSCSFSSCSGNSCELQCSAPIQYHAEPTDAGTYVAEDWLAELTIVDSTAERDDEITLGVDLLTFRALSVDNDIDYGSLAVTQDTGATTSTTTIENLGNEAIDVGLSGTDMEFGASAIEPTNQKYSTSTFTYGSCSSPSCENLSTTSTNFEVDLIKPTSSSTSITDDLFWGLFVPTGVAAAAHEGTNTFTAVGD